MNSRLSLRTLLQTGLLGLICFFILALTVQRHGKYSYSTPPTALSHHDPPPSLSVSGASEDQPKHEPIPQPPVQSLVQSSAQIPAQSHTTKPAIPSPVPSEAPRHRNSFDIVVAYHSEKLEDLKNNLDQIRAMPQLSQYNETRVFVYTKNGETDIPALEQLLEADVFLIPNRGRESGTYLTHILQRWDDLGDHIMFIQGGMHNPVKSINHVADYLVPVSEPGQPSTGVITMSDLISCQCTMCHDPWSSSITWSRISELYVLFNQQLCSKDVVITYSGQLVVSRKRIHARKRETFKHIKDVLESEMDHPIHSDPRDKGVFGDDINNPYFGHAIERGWMVIFDCAGTDIIDRCGSGKESTDKPRGPDDDDDKCQCMDD